jgi:hypothetical protein
MSDLVKNVRTILPICDTDVFKRSEWLYTMSNGRILVKSGIIIGIYSTGEGRVIGKLAIGLMFIGEMRCMQS